MAIQAIPVVGSQLDRAVVAYLIANGVGLWKWTKNGDCVIAPANSLQVKTFPNLTVSSHQSEHDPIESGNEDFQVSIACKFSAAGAAQQSNPYAARVMMDATIGLMLACMLQSNDGATLDLAAANITAAGLALATSGSAQDQANNADMANFTALQVHFLGTSARGRPDEAGCDWVHISGFKIIACPSAIN